MSKTNTLLAAFGVGLFILVMGSYASATSMSVHINNYFRSIIEKLPKEDRQPPVNSEEVLRTVTETYPTDVAVILSYGTVNTKRYIGFGTNPVGHIAIRIGDQVYTINGLAVSGQDKAIIHQSSLFEYLYGTEKPTKNIFHGDAYGNSYIQGSIYMGAKGVTEEQKQAMLRYIDSLNRMFNEDGFVYEYAKFNCANFVFNTLKAGGIIPEKLPIGFRAKPVKLPLDVFSLVGQIFNDAKYKAVSIIFPQVRGEGQLITGVRFPVSPFKPRELVRTLFKPRTSNSYEQNATIEVKFDPESHQLSYDVRGGSCKSSFM